MAIIGKQLEFSLSSHNPYKYKCIQYKNAVDAKRMCIVEGYAQIIQMNDFHLI